MILAKRLVDRNFVWGLARRKETKMKTIFRYANLGLLVAAMMAIGALAVLAQTPAPVDPCADADGMTTLGDKVRAEFLVKTIEGRTKFLESGKQFQEKYGKCEPGKELDAWLTTTMPKTRTALDAQIEADRKAKLLSRFDGALDAKNWDEVSAAGKEVLAKYPDEFRTVEIVLAALGGEEAFKGNFKYADDGIKFGKQSIADLDAGKAFMVGKDIRYGLAKKDAYNFAFSTKEDAIAWMNLYIGYMTSVHKKDKVGSLPYLYKATQANSDTKKNPVSYGLIGYYYVEQGDKLTDEIKALEAQQDAKDTEEVAKQKLDAIRAKVALSNGVNQRAIDAFARAHSLSTSAEYKATIKKALDFSFNRRFGKMEGLDAWVANAVKQPFESPTTPVTPISDPEPVKTDATSTTPTAPATTAPAKAGTPTTTTKPAGPIKPAPAKPGSGVKPQATVKKVAKKKVG